MTIEYAAATGEPPATASGSIGTIVSGEASKRQRRFVFSVALTVAVLSAVLLPFVSQPLPEIPESVPFYVAGVVITDLITAFLLFSQFHQDRSVPLLVLAAAYLFTGLIVIPHLLAFPDFTTKLILFGNAQSSAWLWHFWHLGFPTLALVHGLLFAAKPDWRVAPERSMIAIGGAVAAAVTAVLLLTMLATVWSDALPLLHDGRKWQEPTFQLGWTMGFLTLAALAALWIPGQPRTFLHLWLSVALVAFFFDFTPNLLALQRYSVGWYLGRFNGLLASTFLLLMFLWETNRLYQSLGRTTRELSVANATLERKVSERTAHLEQANAAVRDALSARDILLSEVYHRVKNNLQTLDSLLAFEERNLSDTDAAAAFERARKRVLAMGLVHQQLLESEDMSRVDLGDFISALTEDLAIAFGADQRGISFEVVCDPIRVDLERATSLGLLINELVSNAFKHGFDADKGGSVHVKVERIDEQRVSLTVADSGRGIQASAKSGQESAGTRIAEALVRQLNGETRIESNGGTSVRVIFDLKEEDW